MIPSNVPSNMSFKIFLYGTFFFACRECIETGACGGNLLCSGASHQCLLPPLMLFSIKYEGIFPADFTDALRAKVCSNVLSLVPGLKGRMVELAEWLISFSAQNLDQY